MTNEEKILAMLESLTKGQSDMQADIASLKQGQQNLEQGQQKLEQGQLRLEIKVENEVDRAIKLLAEGHEILNRKLDEDLGLEPRVETVENKVSALEYLAQAQ